MELKISGNQVLALINNVLVGTLTFSKEEQTLIIQSVFVDPIHRGKKIGTKLVEYIVNHARENLMKVLPFCSFAVYQFEINKSYSDVLKV